MAKRRGFSTADVARLVEIVKRAGYRIVSVSIEMSDNVTVIKVSASDGSEIETKVNASPQAGDSEADLDRELAEWKVHHGH